MKTCILTGLALALTLGSAAPVLAAANDEGSLFISPCGKPYRSGPGEPYPSIVWFKEADKNGDGKLDQTEFRADAEAFFQVLDRNADGVISNQEAAYYEYRIAPEIVVTSQGRLDDSRLPLNQRPGFVRAQMPGPPSLQSTGERSQNEDPGFDSHLRMTSRMGAVQFSYFPEPEPVRAADRNLDYKITLAEFIAAADRHFKTLDKKGLGYLTYDALPKTPIQTAGGIFGR